MQQSVEQKPDEFVNRRSIEGHRSTHIPERRQFRDSSVGRSSEVAELADAIDQYKLRHRRRFITFEELHDVIVDLGYCK